MVTKGPQGRTIPIRYNITIYLFCMQQTQQGEGRQVTGRWSKEQHQRFMYAIMQYGKDWKKVEQYVATRSSSQVRSHAQKFFKKLQKTTQGGSHPPPKQEHQETELDIEWEVFNDVTPCTPIELVSLIRKQSKEEGGKINVTNLRQSLAGPRIEQKIEPQCLPSSQPLPNSFKSMSNILSAYEEVNNRQTAQQDESFFITITKKYKKLFRQVEDFDRLIDLHQNTNGSDHPQRPATNNRKRSFTLPQGSNLEQGQLEERIQEIKKKINEEGQVRRGRKERKDSDSSIQFIPPPLNKLSTIHEQPREQEENLSFRAIASQEKLNEVKQ